MIKDAEGNELFRVKMKNKSFSLDLMKEEHNAYNILEQTTELWHKRLGHFNQAALLLMRTKEMVQGLSPLVEYLPSCRACQFGKQTRLSFPQQAWRATKKLQLIHTNLSGPKIEPSLKRSRYYIAFIDDFTRMSWIYFLRFKSEVAGIFWRFKAWIENQSGCKIKAIRSDNGTEYTSN